MVTETSVTVRCSHCRLPVPAALIEDGAANQFCCAGCRAVYESINACGLSNYYRLRDAADVELQPAHPRQSKYEAFDSETFAKLYIEPNDQTNSVDLALDGVTCGACVWLVENLPTVLEGVIDARLSLRRATVRVTWDPSRVKLSAIARTLDRFGYPPSPARDRPRQASYRAELRKRLIDLGVAGALAGNLMLIGAALYAGWFGGMDGQYVLMFRVLSLLLGVISLAWPGREFFRSAFIALRARQINLDVPICMALAAGGVAGVANVLLNRGEIYFDSLAALIFLLLIGRFLQFQQQRRSEASIDLLFSLTPISCRLVTDNDDVSEVPVEALQLGQTVEVRPGELLPADGVVSFGESDVNAALLTGESRPQTVRSGDAVFAGTQNGASTLRVRVTAGADQTRIGGIMRLLERGLTEKPQIVRFTDKVGRWFVIAVTLVAIATFAMWLRAGFTTATDHAIALIIVTCPCVLGLATPMTLAVAIGQLARRDILVKSAAAIERLSRGGALLLDKTGTLTYGQMRVVEWIGDNDLRGVVAAMEKESTHPVALALAAEFAMIEPPAIWRQPIAQRLERGDGGVTATVGGRRICIGSRNFVTRHAVRISSELRDFAAKNETLGRSVVFIAVDEIATAAAAMADRLREDAAQSVSQLRDLGFDPAIYSGDTQLVVNEIARAAKIDRAIGGVSPEEKLAAVRSQNTPHTVMIGDGVNDAAALAAAGVGIAVHGGAEASLAAADVYIARPGLSRVVDLVQTSRRAMRIVRFNLAISLAYNLLAGAMAVAGIMTPLAAAIIMPLSSATVLSIATIAMRQRTEAK